MALLGGHNNSVTELLKIEIATNSVIHNVSSSEGIPVYIIYSMYMCVRET